MNGASWRRMPTEAARIVSFMEHRLASDIFSVRERTLHHYRLASKIHRWFAKQLDEAFAFSESERSRIRVEGSNAHCAASPTRPDCFGESQNLRPQAPSLISFTEQ